MGVMWLTLFAVAVWFFALQVLSMFVPVPTSAIGLGFVITLVYLRGF